MGQVVIEFVAHAAETYNKNIRIEQKQTTPRGEDKHGEKKDKLNETVLL